MAASTSPRLRQPCGGRSGAAKLRRPHTTRRDSAHTRPGLRVPDGIRLVYLPPHSPELQPAECLWPVLDEPLANKHFATLQDLDRMVADRCITFVATRDLYRGRVDFHWWPKPIRPA
jgi:transposase